jgi:acetolactate synthase-1/3 small subunit
MNPLKTESFTISLTVRNQPGVLVRCAQVLSRRGYNIDALKVHPEAHNNGQSTMMIVMKGDVNNIRQVKAQLYKLIDVISIN